MYVMFYGCMYALLLKQFAIIECGFENIANSCHDYMQQQSMYSGLKFSFSQESRVKTHTKCYLNSFIQPSTHACRQTDLSESEAGAFRALREAFVAFVCMFKPFRQLLK
jgi:hypothetical protein